MSEKNGDWKWIPTSEGLPENDTEVFIMEVLQEDQDQSQHHLENLEEDLENNFANLTAIRIPQRFHKWLYPSISQVNIFRLIFAVIENKQPSFIADYSYSTHYDGGSGFGKVHKYER